MAMPVRHKSRSLQRKLMMVVTLIILATNLLIMIFLNNSLYSNLADDIVADNRQRIQQVKNNFNAIMSQIGEDMMEINREIQAQMTGSDEILDRYSAFSISFSNYYLMLTRSMRSYQYIHSMMLFTQNGSRYLQSPGGNLKYNQDDLYKKVNDAFELGRIINWSGLLTEDFYFQTGEKGTHRIVSAVMPLLRNYRLEAVFVVNLNIDKMENYLSSAQEKEYLVLQLNEDQFITGIMPEAEAAREEVKFLRSNFERENFIETPNYYIFTERIPACRWKMTMFYSKARVRQDIYSTLKVILLQVGVVGLAMLLFGIFLVYEVTDPIKRVTQDIIRSEESGSLQPISFTPKKNDEVSIMVVAYNRLIAKIRQNLNRLEEDQKLKDILYLRNLQMQINPHFLHNSLEALRYLVEMGDERAGDYITAMGDFYKYSLITEGDMTSLDEEIRHVDSYLRIMKFRYGSKFDYEIDAVPDLLDNVAVKLTLQPLAENALEHGIRKKHEKGLIRISVCSDGTDVFIKIYDNGPGISEEKLSEIRSELERQISINRKEHIGLLNTHQRIRMHFGENYGLHIESSEGTKGYTEIIVQLPLRKYT